MAEGRGKASWAQTSAILSMIVNVNRDPKKRATKPSDFDPYARKNRHAGAFRIESMGELKKCFVSD